MRFLHEYVARFMKAGGQPIREYPGVPDQKTIALGLSLIDEELSELRQSIKIAIAECSDEGQSGSVRDAMLAQVADAIGDLLYVVTWNGLAWGFPMPKVVDEIQRANMEKFGVGGSVNNKRSDGKVMKPVGWKPPNIKRYMRDLCRE